MKNIKSDYEKLIIKLENTNIYNQGQNKKKALSISVPENELRLLQINIEKFNELTGLNVNISSVIGNTLKDLNKKLQSDIKQVQSSFTKETRNEYLINDYQKQIDLINQEIQKLKEAEEVNESQMEIDFEEEEGDTYSFDGEIKDLDRHKDKSDSSLDQDLKDLSQDKPSSF